MSSQKEGFYLETEKQIVHIDYEKCITCGVCIENCPFGALELVEGVTTWAHPELCENCGICSIVCPEEAIILVSEAEG